MIDYKGVIFDLDGTILDSLKVWQNVDRDFFIKRGLNIPLDYTKNISGMTILETAQYTKDICGIDDSIEDIIEEWKKSAYSQYKNKVKLKKGALEYITFLKENNIKIGIATACEKKLYEACLKKHKIYDLFDTIIDSTFVERGKSFPDIYELCAKNLDLSPKDIIVFEDILDAINGAKKAGMRVYAVYDENSQDNLDDILNASDEYITDFREMIV